MFSLYIHPYISHKSRISANVSFCLLQERVSPRSLNLKTFEMKLRKRIVDLKLVLRFSASHKLSVHSLQDLNTPTNKGKPIKALNLVISMYSRLFPNTRFPSIFEFKMTILSTSFVIKNIKADSSSRNLQVAYLVGPSERFRIYFEKRLTPSKEGSFLY